MTDFSSHPTPTKVSRLGRCIVAIVALLAVSCAPGTDAATPPSPLTEADLRGFARGSGDCAEMTVKEMVEGVNAVSSWVLISAEAANDAFSLPIAGIGVYFDEAELTYLGGADRRIGAAIDRSLKGILGELAAQNADLIIAVSPSAESGEEPYPTTAFVALLPDGRVAWVGACGYGSVTVPINGYLDTIDGDRRAEVLRIFSGDPDALAAIDTYQTSTHTDPEPLTWHDLPAHQRNIDPEDTPPDYLTDFTHVEVHIQIPQAWHDWNIQICGLSLDGWHGCASTRLGSAGIPMLIRPGQPIGLHILDETGRFDSRMEHVGTIDAATLAKATNGGTVVATVTDSYTTLTDMRTAAAQGTPIFTATALTADEFRQDYVEEGGATETNEP